MTMVADIKIHKHHIIGTVVIGLLLLVANIIFVWPKGSSAASLDCNTATSINVPAQECRALTDLYNSTNGPSWINNTNWMTDSDICMWDGISCTFTGGTYHVYGVNLISNNLSGTLPASLSGINYVDTFLLMSNNLTGSLPSSLSTWSHITSFYVNATNIHGTLPASWSGWRNIQYFRVEGNYIDGTLPTEWSTWSGIQEFRIGGNNLTGTLPTSWATWTGIKKFLAVGNSFIGTLPTSWSGWKQIQQFRVDENNLTGSLPVEWSTWSGIQDFNISGNSIVGSIPSVWGTGWKSIQYLYLNNNYLTGLIPSNWTGMSTLISGQLTLDYNCFDSTLSGPIGTFVDGRAGGTGWRSTQTNCYPLGDISIQKTTSTSYASTGDLVYYTIAYSNNGSSFATGVRIYDTLQTGFNYITGTFSTGITVAGQVLSRYITGLSAGSTGAFTIEVQVGTGVTSGTVMNNTATIAAQIRDTNTTDNISTASSITILGAVGVSGTDCNAADVPFQECQALVDLYNSTNGSGWYTTGGWTMNNTICTWDNINCTSITGQLHVTTVALNSNNLTGSLLPSLSGINYVQNFYISNNNIRSALPSSLSAWHSIQDFQASSSLIRGNLPSSWGNWNTLQYFDISNNSLTGTLPTSWSGMTNIQHVDIGLNNLTGTLPTEWSTWGNIQYFAMNNNHFTGTLPITWSGWRDIQTFYGHDNNINGSLPIEWSTWTGIQLFFVSNNKISGTLPTEWSTWTGIHLFFTYDNFLTGSLPTERSSWRQIVNFSISNNTIHNTLPIEWSTWTSVRYFNMSRNQLTGTLPSERSGWAAIENLTMSSNSIVGSLPSSWGNNWTSIQALYVNSNYLSNLVPSSWTGMSLITNGELNLNTNCLDTTLSGPIGTFVDTKAGSTAWRSTQTACGAATNLPTTTTGDLAIQKTTSTIYAYTGDIITYTISYVNSGTSTVTGVKIYDTLPTGLTYITGTLTSGFVRTGQNMSWNLNGVNAGTTGSFTIQAQVDNAVASGSILSNTATITGSIIDVDTGNNTSTASGITVFGDSIGGLFSATDCNAADVPYQECKALTDLFNSTNGSGWTNNSGWTLDNTICGWYGVTCSYDIYTTISHVTGLILDGNQLTGTLPASLSGINYIQIFDVNQNELTGNLPTTLSTWTGIQYFNIHHNNLLGSLPTERSTWTNIKSFKASYNKLEGTLPEIRSGWINIQDFQAHQNTIKGNLPITWSTWNKMQIFSVDSNELTGTLPSSWDTRTGVQTFYVNNNNLTGSLPVEWSTWANLQIFQAGENNFIGTLPNSWSGWINLHTLGLNNNYLNNLVPSSWTNMISLDTGYLNLNYNCLDTTLAGSIGTFVDDKGGTGWRTTQTACGIVIATTTGDLAIQKTTASVYAYTGDIITYTIFYTNSGTSTVTGVTIFDTLATGFTYITGSLSTGFIITGQDMSWNLSGLSAGSTGSFTIQVQVDNSVASGTILTNTATITGSIIDIDTGNNTSTASSVTVFGDSIGGLFGATDCNAADVPYQECKALTDLFNSTNGSRWTNTGNRTNDNTICGWYGVTCSYDSFAAVYHVTGVVLYSNQLSGTLPDSLSGINYIQTFNLSHNQLTGSLPTSLSTWSDITSFDIRDNNLHGTLPTEWATWTGVQSVFINSNSIGGSLPDTWSGWRNIKILDVSTNQFTGALPTEWANWTGIQEFHADSNQLNGTLPIEWANWTSINKFTVGFNNLQGNLSTGRSTWNNIQFFSISQNNLTGTLPTEWANWTSIQNMNITSNHFTGTLPNSWSAWTNIQYFAVTDNNIHGTLPSTWGSSWTNIQTLGAAYNYLSQLIPTSWTSMTSLITGNMFLNYNCLDNTLSGSIGSFVDDRAGSTLWRTTQIHCPSATGDLIIQKSTTGTILHPGDNLTYSITYTNSGTNDINSVSIYDTLQTGLIYVSSDFTGTSTISGQLINWNVGTMAANTSGIIHLLVQIDPSISSGTLISNSAFIMGNLIDLDTGNDTGSSSGVTIIGTGTTTTGSTSGGGGGGSGTGNTGGTGSTDGGRSGGGGSNGTGGNNGSGTQTTSGNIDIIPTTDPLEDPLLGSASNDFGDVCLYHDGDFARFKNTFSDIKNTIFKPAVDLMLDNCLVQGYANKGTTFGVYNNVKWGEAYKVFTRLAGLPFHEIPNSSHWSDKYRVAGESIGLWARTSTGKHPVNGTITLADIYTISNNLLHYYHKNQIEYNPSLKYGDAVKRGDFALFMEKVIRQVKQ